MARADGALASTQKRSLTLSGHRTSVSLEQEFWDALNEIADKLGKPLARLVDEIDKRQGRGKNLSSALRLFVLAHYRNQRG